VAFIVSRSNALRWNEPLALCVEKNNNLSGPLHHEVARFMNRQSFIATSLPFWHVHKMHKTHNGFLRSTPETATR
jgi:hypothetical protein